MASKLRVILALAAMLAGTPAWAVLSIKITQGIEGALPIAVVPFDWQGAAKIPPESIGGIIGDDLSRSGRFQPLPESDLPGRPHDGSQINFRDWRLLGTENLVVGRLLTKPDGSYQVQFQLFDVFKGVQVAGYSIPSRASDLRRTAHQISDIVYQKLTGERGAFATHIAYVTELGSGKRRTYALQVADSDGHNPQTVLESRQPILSPAWAPDGRKLAYVSFENQHPAVFIQNLANGKRETVSALEGLNSAPAWSPDGQRLALTLSKDGDPEIYIMDLKSRKLTRLTRNSAIDTEPDWSPDGRRIVFTSDRGGRPQLYQVASEGGRAKRLTFEGAYNARGKYAPDGESLTLVHGNKGKYRIAMLDLKTSALRVLTDASLDESPSFAPNGAMIIYATADDRGGALAAVSADGRVHQRLTLSEGGVREPAWSPFLK